MSKRNHKNHRKQALAQLKALRGIERARFLEENGDMKQWRPPRIVIQCKKKSRNKRACRGKWDG